MSCSMIRLDGVSKHFDRVAAVDETSFCVERGEVVALLGPSGCGKTTLLRLVAGFERPDVGTVEVAGRTVSGRGSWVPPEKRRVGMVFQDYALFPHLTVAENVGFGLPRRARAGRVSELLAIVGLDTLDARYPHQLSGGQQQRVALARALAPAPELVLLDEPWSNVDPSLRESLRAEVTEIIRPLGITVVLVTHDREEAFSVADRIALMRNGKVVQEGTPEDLYFAPSSRWAAAFVGAGNVLTGRVAGGLVETPIGVFPANGASAALAADVLVRPELLELQPDPAGAGEVVAREFRGHDVFYRVLLDGVELVSHRPSTEVVPLGSRVSIRLHDGHVPVLY
ncbi:MAG: ABC transporter ATP-binding protein [Actinomycetota bacterium]|nr:ABC transporter ATP-binding protein [Actinomycetota bacterium]